LPYKFFAQEPFLFKKEKLREKKTNTFGWQSFSKGLRALSSKESVRGKNFFGVQTFSKGLQEKLREKKTDAPPLPTAIFK